MCDWQQQPGESDQYAPAMKEVEADALRSGQGGKRERKKRSIDDADLGHGLPIPQTPRLEVTGGDGYGHPSTIDSNKF